MSHCLFDEPFAEGAGVGEVDGELSVTVGAFRRLVKEVHVVALAASSILCVFQRGLLRPLCGSVAEAPSANPTPAPRAHLARARVEEHREWLTVFHGNSFIH